MRKLKLKNPPMKVVPDNSSIHWHGYPADKGGCGILRVIIPSLLTNTYRIGKHNIQLNPSYGIQYISDKNFYKNKLFIIIQRAATANQLKFIKYLKTEVFKETNTKIIYELDDNLFLNDIPEWNMAYSYFKKNQQNCLNIIENAYGVTCSTEHLAGKLRKVNKNVKVNLNHLPKFIWGPNIPEIKEIKDRKPRVYWGGSSNHFALPNSKIDGGDFGPEFINFVKKTIDLYNWVFIGAIPKEFSEIKDKIELHPWQTPLYYPHFMKSLDVDVGVAPLYKCEFNRSKSNIKAMEYTASGFPGVYTNITPYENLTLACDTDEEIIENIEILANDVDKRKEVWQKDYEILEPQLFWEDNNNIKKYLDNFLNFFNMRLPDDI